MTISYMYLTISQLWSHTSFMFFFFKQKTAYEMRISDWSSDVCSSDLKREGQLNKLMGDYIAVKELYQKKSFIPDANSTLRLTYGYEIGRASCRERVCQYV